MADGNFLEATHVCDDCHSPDGAFPGGDPQFSLLDLHIGAKANWNEGIYEADGVTLKSGKEDWCATCHDDAPAYSRQTESVAPVPAVEIVVDNPDATVYPEYEWSTLAGHADGYGVDLRYKAAGEGGATATWTPDVPEAGDYSVYAWWIEGSQRATNAAYTIYYDGGFETFYVNQKECDSGGKWNLLGTGTYPFAAGTSGYVVLSGEPGANEVVVADAIKLEAGDPPGIYAPNVIGDNSTYGFYATGHGAHGFVECLECHDAGKTHIDHEHRTYASACDNYQAGYRLARPMVVPRPNRSDVYAYLDDFALCGDCHNLYEPLGVDAADTSHTNFWHDDESPRNSHKFHIGMLYDTDRDWVFDSRGTCIACHNVHGSPGVGPMIRHGELISTYGTDDKVPGLNFSYVPSGAELINSTGSRMDPPAGFCNGFCSGACHGGSVGISRTPYLSPKVLNTEAYPSIVPADVTTEVLLTALVDYDGGVVVTIDLSPIDGGVETMYDYGTNGDLTANDKIYSYKTTVPETVALGSKSFQITATSSFHGEGSNNMTLYVGTPGAVDNTEGTYSGTWGDSTYTPGYYGTDYHYHDAGSGTETFTWTPTITTAGTYGVWARWVESPSYANDATYTIYHDGGNTPVEKDQQDNGGEWVFLGAYDFDGAGVEKVKLVQSASGIVIADAIKLELEDHIIRDDINAAYEEGTWPSFTHQCPIYNLL
jgi:hypothetical protein